MMRLITPIILIGISVAIFFAFSSPIYSQISKLRAQASSYDDALGKEKDLENKKNELTQKESSMAPDDLVRIKKLLPDNVDNIRLILEIEQIASPYGMMLKDVKYDATTDAVKGSTNGTNSAGAVAGTASINKSTSKDYGIWDLSFSTTGTYSNFLNFMRDLQNNLRIVDISSIQFSSSTILAPGKVPIPPELESYTYSFKIKTYWLKN